MVDYVPAEIAHATSIAPRLREADRAEIQAALGLQPEVALTESIQLSTLCKTVMIDGKPEGLFGVVEVNPLVGVVWMVGTDELVRLHTRFYRAGKSWFTTLHERWPVLVNYIDSRNKVHLRWLMRMGAEFLTVEPEYGAERRPFLLFRHVSSSRGRDGRLSRNQRRLGSGSVQGTVGRGEQPV